MNKRPGDLARIALIEVARALRADIDRPHHMRVNGVSADALHLAADVLQDLADGKDPRKRIDRRAQGFPQEEAVSAVIDAMPHCGSWDAAFQLAAEQLSKDVSVIRKHFRAYEKARGIEYVFMGSRIRRKTCQK